MPYSYYWRPVSQVYSVAPAQGAADATSLIAADVEQARVLMSALLSSDTSEQALAFAGNSSSMVKGAHCPRKLGPRKTAAAGSAPPPRPKSQSAPPRAGADQVKAPQTAAHAPASEAKSASVAAVPVKTEDGEKERLRPAASKSAAAPPEGKKRSALAASFGKAAQRQAKGKLNVTVKQELPEKPEADVPAQREEEKAQPAPTSKSKKGKGQLLDSDDEQEAARSESESPLPSRPIQTKRPAQLLDDDSDDDFTAPAKPSAGPAAQQDIKTKQDKNKASKVAKQTPAEPEAQTEEQPGGVEGEAPKQALADAQEQKPAAVEVMSDRSNGQAASVREHPEYGMPPHPDAEIRMVGSKAFWEYIDDKGAEVSVIATSKAAKAPPVKQEKPQAKRPQPDAQNATTTAAEKPAKRKKAAGKNAKAAAGVGDIRAMFGKK